MRSIGNLAAAGITACILALTAATASGQGKDAKPFTEPRAGPEVASDEKIDLDTGAFNDALFARMRATVAPDWPGPLGAPPGERRICPPIRGTGLPSSTGSEVVLTPFC